MGAQGIRRRKPRHPLPDVKNLPPGDEQRLFGRFTWGAYSPAGAMERGGFMLRQLRRNGGQGVASFFSQARWVFVGFFALIAVVVIGVRLAR